MSIDAMPDDERQEVTHYARSWGRRMVVFREALIAEGVSPFVADEATVWYARNFLVPDYSASHKKQAEHQAALLERVLDAALRGHDEGDE